MLLNRPNFHAIDATSLSYPVGLTTFGTPRPFSVTLERRELRQNTYSPNKTQTQFKIKTNGPKWNSVVK